MGMDVYGKAPANETGKYFRNNVWWWRPLAHYICETAPDIAQHCEHWQSNDGDGLNAEQSRELATRLKADLASGRVAAHAAIREAEIDAMPDEPCYLCQGTGTRSDALGVDHGFTKRVITEPATHPRFGQTGWCNACDGRGRRRPDDASYPFSVENVEEFVAFLENCGGFEIS